MPGLGGHVHAYGRELRLEEVLDDGSTRVLWRTHPEESQDGRVERVPRATFLLRGGLELSSERRYRIVAVYENPTGQVLSAGGMAEIGRIVLPEEAWPAPERSEPAFLDDYRSFTGHRAGATRSHDH